MYWAEPDDEFSALFWAPTRAPGFPGRKDVAARYAARLGAGPLGDRLLRRPRLLEGRLHPGRRLRPLRLGCLRHHRRQLAELREHHPQVGRGGRRARPPGGTVRAAVMTDRPRVFVTRPLPAGGTDPLAATDGPGPPCEIVQRTDDEPLDKDGLIAALEDGIDGVVAVLTERFDADVYAAGKGRLRVVANVAVGYDNIDVDGGHRRRCRHLQHPRHRRRPHRRRRVPPHPGRQPPGLRGRGRPPKRPVGRVSHGGVPRSRRPRRHARPRRLRPASAGPWPAGRGGSTWRSSTTPAGPPANRAMDRRPPRAARPVRHREPPRAAQRRTAGISSAGPNWRP